MISSHLIFFFGEGCAQPPLLSAELQLTSEVPAGPTWSLCEVLGIDRSSGGVVCLIGVGRDTHHLRELPSFCFIFTFANVIDTGDNLLHRITRMQMRTVWAAAQGVR